MEFGKEEFKICNQSWEFENIWLLDEISNEAAMSLPQAPKSKDSDSALWNQAILAESHFYHYELPYPVLPLLQLSSYLLHGTIGTVKEF